MDIERKHIRCSIVLSISRDAIPAVFPTHVFGIAWTLWPSGLRRWLKAPFRKGVGSNPTVVILRMLRVRRNDVCGRPNDARN